MYKVYVTFTSIRNGKPVDFKGKMTARAEPMDRESVIAELVRSGHTDIRLYDHWNCPDGQETPFGSVPRI